MKNFLPFLACVLLLTSCPASTPALAQEKAVNLLSFIPICRQSVTAAIKGDDTYLDRLIKPLSEQERRLVYGVCTIYGQGFLDALNAIKRPTV